MLYVGLLAVLTFLFGVAEALEARHLERELGPSLATVVLGIAGAGTVVLAVVQFVLLPEPVTLRRLLITGMVLQSLTMLAVALGAGALRQGSRGS